MTQKLAVIAIGGNSLIKDKKHQSVEDQYDAAYETAGHIAKMIQAGWTAILGLFGATPGLVAGVTTTNILWILWALLTVITFFWTYRQTRVPGAQPAWTQVFISTFAFVVWVLALGAPFNTLAFYDTRLAAAILIVFTLGVGAVQPRE